VLTIGNRQRFTTDGAASGQEFAAVRGCHLGKETMGSDSFDFARLISHFCHYQHLLAYDSKNHALSLYEIFKRVSTTIVLNRNGVFFEIDFASERLSGENNRVITQSTTLVDNRSGENVENP